MKIDDKVLLKREADIKPRHLGTIKEIYSKDDREKNIKVAFETSTLWNEWVSDEDLELDNRTYNDSKTELFIRNYEHNSYMSLILNSSEGYEQQLDLSFNDADCILDIPINEESKEVIIISKNQYKKYLQLCENNEMMLSLLKKCPWCNTNRSLFLETLNKYKTFYYVKCKDCGCYGPKGESKKSAVINWNTCKTDNENIELQ